MRGRLAVRVHRLWRGLAVGSLNILPVQFNYFNERWKGASVGLPPASWHGTAAPWHGLLRAAAAHCVALHNRVLG